MAGSRCWKETAAGYLPSSWPTRRRGRSQSCLACRKQLIIHSTCCIPDGKELSRMEFSKRQCCCCWCWCWCCRCWCQCCCCCCCGGCSSCCCLLNPLMITSGVDINFLFFKKIALASPLRHQTQPSHFYHDARGPKAQKWPQRVSKEPPLTPKGSLIIKS